MDYLLVPDNELSTSQKVKLVMIGFVGVITVGTFGFMFLEDLSFLNALYMTVITLSTVGFGEVNPLHPAGRIFVIFLIIFGVALSGYTVTILGRLILEGQLKEFYGRRKMESKIATMKNHYIIAGYGRVGRQVAMEFKKKKVDFIVIEKSNESVFDLYKDKVMFIQGEATDDDVLRKANIDNANTLVSTLPNEAENVYLTLTARDMNKKLKIIARADYDDGIKKLKRAGADHVVTPHVLGGIRMAMASLRPNVVDFMHTTALGEGGLMIEEMVIPENCFLVGKSLIESNLKNDHGITIIGIKKSNQEMNITPGPNTVLQANDIMVLIGHQEELETLSKKLV